MSFLITKHSPTLWHVELCTGNACHHRHCWILDVSVCRLVDLGPRRHCSSSYDGGSSSQRLVIAASLLLIIIIVLATTTLDCSTCIGLVTLPHL
jgi:hypothetical protein